MRSLFGNTARKCGLVALLLLSLVLPSVHAATVTSATCALDADNWCINSTLTFTGTDLASVSSVVVGLTAEDKALMTCGGVVATATEVTCTLAVAASARAGLFPATLVLSDATTADAGSFLIGTFYEQDSLARWTSTTSASPYRVTGMSSDWPSTGDAWSITGTFNTATTYSVIFYNNQKKAVLESPGLPSCAPVTVTATTLSCIVVSTNGVMGMYNFLVRDMTTNELLLGSTSLDMLAFNPPLPEVTAGSGDCATNSSACISGTMLTFTGINFNYRDPSFQKFYVGVTAAQRSAIRLTPSTVSKTGITTTLTIGETMTAGSYPIYVSIQVCFMGMMAPWRYIGNLVLDSQGEAGFNLNELNATVAVEEVSPPVVKNDTPGYKAAVGFAVVFGLLFFALCITLIVMCCRCRFVRKGKGSQELFLDGRQTEMRSEAGGPAYYNGAASSRYEENRL